MTDAGEVAADIGLEYVVHLLGHDLQAQRLQSVVRVAPRPKAVTAVEEIRFEHGLDDARYRPLQQPIRDRGESPMGAFRFCPGLWVFQPAGPVVRDRRRLEAVCKSLRPAAST